MVSKKHIKCDASDCIQECEICPYNEGGLYENCQEINEFLAKDYEEELDFFIEEEEEYFKYTLLKKPELTLGLLCEIK